MTSCAEWTGVLLSLLLKEAGVKDGAFWTRISDLAVVLLPIRSVVKP